MNLSEIIQYYPESYNVDFKRCEYPLGKEYNKTEFLKDVSAMANHPSHEPKYIFTGIIEKDGMASSFIEISPLTDQAKYQQYLEENIEPSIHFEYKQVEHDGIKLGCFIISGNVERPYLFKKEVKNAKRNELEYKPGDGVIRVGTSTRKMIRSDFESIYKARNKTVDRKKDILITPYLKKCENPIIHKKGYRCIDFKIENTSNKSISLDIEAHFYFNEDYHFSKKFDIDKKIIQKSKSNFNLDLSLRFEPIIDNSIFDLSFQNTESSLLVSRIKKINQKSAVEIAQNAHEDDIFLNEVLVYKKNEVPVLVELIIRSDDFIDGALRQRFEI